MVTTVIAIVLILHENNLGHFQEPYRRSILYIYIYICIYIHTFIEALYTLNSPPVVSFKISPAPGGDSGSVRHSLKNVRQLHASEQLGSC